MVTQAAVQLYQCPLKRYTFDISDMREWARQRCVGRTLNLFAGKNVLGLAPGMEVRNDLDEEMAADYYLDAYDCVLQWDEPTFDTILLDPPYSYRKSMEMYGGRKASRFRMIKDHIPKILKPNGGVITFGYHSVVMGTGRGFRVHEVAIFSHGGAIHDTLATYEVPADRMEVGDGC